MWSRHFPCCLGMCSTAKQWWKDEGTKALYVLGWRAWQGIIYNSSVLFLLALNPSTALPQATIWNPRAWDERWWPSDIWQQCSVLAVAQSWSPSSLDLPAVGAQCQCRVQRHWYWTFSAGLSQHRASFNNINFPCLLVHIFISRVYHYEKFEHPLLVGAGMSVTAPIY